MIELLDAGSHIVATDDLYGGTFRLFERVRRRTANLDITFADLSSADGLAAAVRPETKMIWIETPTNPTLRLVDIAQATRNHDRILQGVSTRSLVLALPALQARALTKQRNYVTADDIDALAGKIFAHRIEPAPGAGDTEALVRDCCGAALERIAGASMSR